MDPTSTISGIGEWITIAVAVSAALATALPPPKGEGWYALLYGVVNFVAFNRGHATNATAPTAKP